MPLKALGDLSKLRLGFLQSVLNRSLPLKKLLIFLLFFFFTWVYCAESFCFNKAHDEVTASSLRELHEYF